MLSGAPSTPSFGLWSHNVLLAVTKKEREKEREREREKRLVFLPKSNFVIATRLQVEGQLSCSYVLLTWYNRVLLCLRRLQVQDSDLAFGELDVEVSCEAPPLLCHR